MHLLARGEDIEFVGVEDQPLVGTRADRLPEIVAAIGAGTVDVDDVAVLLRAVADDRPRRAAQSDAQDQAVAQVELAVDERRPSVTLA